MEDLLDFQQNGAGPHYFLSVSGEIRDSRINGWPESHCLIGVITDYNSLRIPCMGAS